MKLGNHRNFQEGADHGGWQADWRKKPLDAGSCGDYVTLDKEQINGKPKVLRVVGRLLAEPLRDGRPANAFLSGPSSPTASPLLGGSLCFEFGTDLVDTRRICYFTKRELSWLVSKRLSVTGFEPPGTHQFPEGITHAQ
jgi:hypothetical protein